MQLLRLLSRRFPLTSVLCLLGGQAFATTQELLTNGGFEPPYNAYSFTDGDTSITGNIATNWQDNSNFAATTLVYSQDTVNPHDGSSAQRADIGGATPTLQFKQNINLVGTRTYTASIWVRCSTSASVTLRLRQQGSPFTSFLQTTATVGTAWQQLSLTGVVPTSAAAYFMINCTTAASVWMDDAHLGIENTSFHVAPGGSDTTGTGTLAAPFQTVAKAMSLVSAGDTILIRAGTYRETITATQSGLANAPITITNYENEAVTVTGADVIAGPWTVGSNGVFTADVGWDLTVGKNNVFVDGTMVHEAREPNYGSGDLLHPATATMTRDATDTNLITSTAFSGKPDNFYAGARWHAGINETWNWSAGTIGSSAGSTATLSASSTPVFTGAGAGYVYGLLALLDADDEWFLQNNPSGPHTLSLRITGQADPGGHMVEMRRRAYTLDCNGKNYIVVRGLNLRCGDVRMNGTGDVLDRCAARHLSHFLTFGSGYQNSNGIVVSGTGSTVSNCTVRDTAGCGLLITGAANLITRNTIYNTDYSGTYSSAITIGPSTGHTVTFNTAHHSGRDIMHIVGGTGNSGHTIAYNDFSEPGQMCRDLGCLYAFASNAQGATGSPTRIAYNWIHDTAPGGLRILIYLDNFCRNYFVDHNVCWNGTGDSGIRMNGPKDGHQLYHNTLYNCDEAGTHTFTAPFSNSNNPDPTFFNDSGTFSVDLRNHLFLGTAPDAQLTSSATRDFRPKAGAAAIDSATPIAGYNDTFAGAAPDTGAYEAGGPYWVPGVNGWAIDQPGSVTSAATHVTATAATANGTLISAGTAVTTVNLFWGVSDGGTVPAAWANATTLGTAYTGTYQTLAFQLTGLTSSTTYWYRFRSTNANGETWSDSRSFSNVPEFSAPVLAITMPTSSATFLTASSSLDLSGTATDNIGVTQVTWTNSAGGTGTATLDMGTWSAAAIPLQLGSNVITVTAMDAADNIATKMLTVTRITAITTSVQLLANPSFEPPYNAVSGTNSGGTVSGDFPSSWSDNSRTQGKLVNNTYSQETNGTVSGSAFKADLAFGTGTGTPGAVLGIFQNMSFITGRTLTASVWMKASAPCTAQIRFLKSVTSFNTRAVLNCAVTTSWQQFTLSFTPTITEPGRLSLECVNQVVAISFDEASVTVGNAPGGINVSPDGSDTTGDGTLAAPYQTIARALLNGTVANLYPGDTVRLHAGTYRETITLPASGQVGAPITLENSNGEDVTVTGADVVAGPWTAESNGIYSASATWDLGEGLNSVFVDGEMIHEARLPDFGAGDLLHPAATAMTQATVATNDITGNAFSGKPDNFFAGARLHAGINQAWEWQVATIASSTGSTLTADPATKVGWQFSGAGSGYVYGLLSLLDADNEWFYASATQTLNLRITGQADATGHLVEMRRRANTIDFAGKSNIIVRGLNLRCGEVKMSGSGNVLDHCDARHLSHFLTYASVSTAKGGVVVSGSGNTVSHCTLYDTAGCGLLLSGTGHLVTRNHVHHVNYAAINAGCITVASGSTQNIITFNTVHDSGRHIITLFGSGHYVAYNDASQPGQMTRDVGCINSFTTNAQGPTGGPTRIACNWVHDNTAQPAYRILIYLDNYCRNFVVDHNVCWNGTGDAGIRLNGPRDGHKVYHNTLFNCDDVGTHTYTLPFETSNPDPAFWNSSGTYSVDLRNNLFLATTPDAQLTNSGARDFRLKAGAAAIDSATVIPGYNNGYSGAAPDAGAYEVDEPYWVPGVDGFAAPLVSTSAATGITAATASLNGTVNPNGAVTTAQFEYGLDANYGSIATVTFSPADGSTEQSVTAILSGLQPGLTYHYRLTASNATGTASTLDATFTGPTVLTTAATALTATTAMLHATVNPGGITTTVFFSLNGSPAGSVGAGSGMSATGVDLGVTGLAPHTLYTVTTTAINSAGSASGNEAAAITFTTLNTNPTAPDGTAVATTGDTQTISLPFPTMDADGDPVIATNVTGGTHLSVDSFTATTVTFTPATNFVGTDILTYAVSDGQGGTAVGTVIVTIDDNDPPAVAITFPTTQPTYTTTIASLMVRGTATDAVGITQLNWTNDQGGNGAGSLSAGVWTIAAIPLQLGVNLLTITGSDAAGHIATDTFSVTRQTPQPTTYYVAPDGNNNNNGTSLATPFLTIQKGFNTGGAAPGNTVYIRGGTYRERVELNGDGNKGGEPGNDVRIFAYPGETPVLKGSEVVTGWVLHSGSIWKRTGWTINSQQVFVDFDTAIDKHPLQQIGRPPNSNSSDNEYPTPVGTDLADMAPGRFFWDGAASTLYVQLTDNSDPNSHVMEASTTLRTLFLGATKGYFHIKGLTFYHNNASASKPVGNPPGAMVTIDSNCILESCNLQWSDFCGVALGGSGSTVTHCTLSNNGDTGLAGSASFNFVVSDCLVTGNNYRNWYQLWHAGGMKIAGGGAYGTVERNEVANNNGSGVWFDHTAGGNPIIIRDNYIHNNGPKDAGIHFEISKNGWIYNNLLVENERRGIYISASDDTKVFNNTIIRQVGRAGIEVDGMPRAGFTLKTNLVCNNIIYNNTATNPTYDLFMRKNEGADVSGNASDYNVIYRSTGAIQFDLRGDSVNLVKTDLPAWRTLTGWDLHSINADPAFMSGSGTNYILSAASPARDAGTNLVEVSTDYNGVLRPQGASSDIGAFEFEPPPSFYATWAGAHGLTGPNSGPTADFDGDGVLNLLECAFDTDPGVKQTDPAAIAVSGGAIVRHGGPTVTKPDLKALFGRRKDAAQQGLSYAVRFSADLLTWELSVDTPTVVGSDAQTEAVTVPFPALVGGEAPRFFRVEVTSP